VAYDGLPSGRRQRCGVGRDGERQVVRRITSLARGAAPVRHAVLLGVAPAVRTDAVREATVGSAAAPEAGVAAIATRRVAVALGDASGASIIARASVAGICALVPAIGEQVAAPDEIHRHRLLAEEVGDIGDGIPRVLGGPVLHVEVGHHEHVWPRLGLGEDRKVVDREPVVAGEALVQGLFQPASAEGLRRARDCSAGGARVVEQPRVLAGEKGPDGVVLRDEGRERRRPRALDADRVHSLGVVERQIRWLARQSHLQLSGDLLADRLGRLTGAPAATGGDDRGDHRSLHHRNDDNTKAHGALSPRWNDPSQGGFPSVDGAAGVGVEGVAAAALRWLLPASGPRLHVSDPLRGEPAHCSRQRGDRDMRAAAVTHRDALGRGVTVGS
jgi:hypothetical protein